MTCPLCKECPFSKGVCEQRIARGRRFFLMGALALPVARKIERVAQLVQPAYETPRLEHLGFYGDNIILADATWAWRHDGKHRPLPDAVFDKIAFDFKLQVPA